MKRESPNEREWLAERFEEHRPHLRAVAYRMLGSMSEADDAVQEAWLRLDRADALLVLRRAERADHLVAAIDQLGDEPGADGAARAGDEYTHHVLLTGRVVTSRGVCGVSLV